MYVLLSGECAIRARPAHAASIPQQQSQPVSSVLLQHKLTAGAHESGSDTDEEEEPCSAILPPRVARSEAEHSSSFWIHKYMQQVVLSYSRACSGLVVWFRAALSKWHGVFAGSLDRHTTQKAALCVPDAAFKTSAAACCYLSRICIPLHISISCCNVSLLKVNTCQHAAGLLW